MDDDKEDERWNLVAPGIDINMQGPTVSTHDGMEWVHKEDHRRVNRKLNECLKQREWDEECVNELNAQVSGLRARHEFSTGIRSRDRSSSSPLQWSATGASCVGW